MSAIFDISNLWYQQYFMSAISDVSNFWFQHYLMSAIFDVSNLWCQQSLMSAIFDVISSCSMVQWYDPSPYTWFLSLYTQYLSEMVTDHDLGEGRVYPPLSTILQVSVKLATQIGGFAYRENMAMVYPEPMDKERHIRSVSLSYIIFTLLFPHFRSWEKDV